jgi:hypothetical protein
MALAKALNRSFTAMPKQAEADSILEIPFVGVVLNTWPVWPEEKYEDGAMVRWHTAGSILLILNGDNDIIDLRIDGEIYDLKVSLFYIIVVDC